MCCCIFVSATVSWYRHSRAQTDIVRVPEMLIAYTVQSGWHGGTAAVVVPAFTCSVAGATSNMQQLRKVCPTGPESAPDRVLKCTTDASSLQLSVAYNASALCLSYSPRPASLAGAQALLGTASMGHFAPQFRGLFAPIDSNSVYLM